MADALTTPATDNPLDKGKVEELPKDFYTEKEKIYLNTHLQVRLENTWRTYTTIHPEFNQKTYYQVYEENQKIANTHHLEPKKNEDDVVISSGTIEEKLDALLSHVNNLNLTGELDVYDHDMNEVVALARGLEDIVHCTEINEPYSDDSGDEEKRMARQRELLVQGTVFVQEEWLKLWEIKKELKGTTKIPTKFRGVEWTEKFEKVFEGPSRTMLYSPNVFLGNITEFYMERQPFLFVILQMDYELARSKYGKFDNFKYVKKGAIPATPSGGTDVPKTIFDNKWRLTTLKQNQVEVILYQDQPMDEFQILINSMPMLPIGFPLSAVVPRGKYNVAKQIYRLINEKWAYGKAFVSSGSIKEVSALIDEMLRLFVLKTRKSIMPAYVNTSGRVIDRKVLSPGRISMGIDPGALQPIAGNEVQGITAGETGYLGMLRDLVDKSTVSEQFTGQRGKTGTTATEVNTLQQQAQLTLGLTVAVCALLEKKLKYLRMFNLIDNWFEPTGTKVQDIEGVRKLVKTYRRVSRDTAIDGAGTGRRSVYVTDEAVPTPEEIRPMEIKEELETGKPVRKIFLNPIELAQAKLIFYWRVVPKERDSSEQSRILFREQLGDIMALVQMGSRPNMDGIEEDAARSWGKQRSRLFQSTTPLNLSGVGGPVQEDGPTSPDQIMQGRGETGKPPVMSQGAPVA